MAKETEEWRTALMAGNNLTIMTRLWREWSVLRNLSLAISSLLVGCLEVESDTQTALGSSVESPSQALVGLIDAAEFRPEQVQAWRADGIAVVDNRLREEGAQVAFGTQQVFRLGGVDASEEEVFAGIRDVRERFAYPRYGHPRAT